MTSWMCGALTFAWLLSMPTALAFAGGRRIEGVVNINTASADELELLPGIGPAKAELIITRRKAHPFRTVEELVRIKGVGRKMLIKLRPHLTVNGPTTAVRVAGAAATKHADACACPPWLAAPAPANHS